MGSCWGKVRERMGWGGGKGIEGRGLTGTMMTIYITPVRFSRKPQKGTAVLPGGRQKRCPVQWQRRCERGIGTALSHARFCTRIPKNKFENSQIDYGSIVGVALLAGACEWVGLFLDAISWRFNWESAANNSAPVSGKNAVRKWLVKNS